MQGESKLFNPVDLDLSRSTFPMHPTNSCTFNAGRLIPQKVIFVQPGDSIKMNVRNLIKMSTPVYPTMDALFEDIYFFFVPMRSILSRRYGSPSVNDAQYSWAAFIGAQDNLLNMPLPVDGVDLPVLSISGDSFEDWKPGALLDYFDVDYRNDGSLQFSALPLMAYFAIWNENFRDPNLMDPVTWTIDSTDGHLIPYGDVELCATKEELSTVRSSTVEDDYYWSNALGADAGAVDASIYADYWLPFPVCRFHGYFGSLLPWPQRNAEGVELPLGDSADVSVSGNLAATPLILVNNTSSAVSANSDIRLGTTGSVNQSGGYRQLFYSDGSTVNANIVPFASSSTFTASGTADLSTATAANVNALRMAIQKQRWYEKLARSGNRYDELEYGLFGVRPHDSGDDRPQYLGGKRIPLNIEMVASTNGGTSTSSGVSGGSLGALGAYSHTNDEDDYFYHSFDDWGILMCVSCVRHHDTFSSGTDRFWQKLTRDDIYFPTFAHLGEQVTYLHELAGVSATDEGVLGYNPAWEEYRTQFDRVHGLLRPGQNLGFMTYAREYDSDTTLAQFINGSSMVETVDATLAVTSNASGFQFISQKTFDFTFRRCMPTDSIPGLMDHF